MIYSCTCMVVCIDDIYTMTKSLNHNALTANRCKHTQAYMIIDVMNEVTQCAGQGVGVLHIMYT